MAGRLFGPRRGITDSPWGPVGAVLVVLTMTVVAAAFAAVVMMGVAAAIPPLRLAIETRCAGPGSVHCISAVVAYFTLVFLFLTLGLMVACWFRRGATVANSLLLRSPRWRLWQYAVFAVLTVVTLLVLQQVLFYLWAQFGVVPADPAADISRLAELFSFDRPVTVVFLVLLAVIAAPLAEEFVFRGMLFAAFVKTGLGVIGSAILLSALWSVMHWGYSSQNLVALFALGLLFSYIVWRTGSLWPAIVGHAANNLVAVVAIMGMQG